MSADATPKPSLFTQAITISRGVWRNIRTAITQHPTPARAAVRIASRTATALLALADGLLLLARIKMGHASATRNFHAKQQKFTQRINRALGIRVRYDDQALTRTEGTGVLFASNHISELDIPVLGAVLPTAFGGKAELMEMPLFPHIAKLTRFVPIQRYPNFNAEVRGRIRQRLNDGVHVLICPESTTNHLPEVRTFRPALLKTVFDAKAVDANGSDVALTRPAMVHPVALRVPASAHRDFCLKDGLQSVFNLMAQKETVVDVVVCPALAPGEFKNAQALAEAAQQSVARIVNPGQGRYTPLWWKNFHGHDTL